MELVDFSLSLSLPPSLHQSSSPSISSILYGCLYFIKDFRHERMSCVFMDVALSHAYMCLSVLPTVHVKSIYPCPRGRTSLLSELLEGTALSFHARVNYSVHVYMCKWCVYYIHVCLCVHVGWRTGSCLTLVVHAATFVVLPPFQSFNDINSTIQLHRVILSIISAPCGMQIS